jgi:hypothetical protein
VFRNLTYKKKNQLLIAVSILVLILVYQLGIKRTIAAWQAHASASDKMMLLENAPAKIRTSKNELAKINERIGNSSNKATTPSAELLDLLSSYCEENLTILREFPEQSSVVQGDFSIVTNHFVMEGKYASLVKLVYLLEQKSQVGNVVSVTYQLKKDHKSRKMILVAEIFLQNITNISK